MTTPSQHARFRLPRVRLSRALALVAVTAAVAGLLPASPAAAAQAPIGASFFGVHHAGLHADGALGWPQTTVGSVRLWDNGVSWRDLETAPGVFDWTRVDAEMLKAREHGGSAGALQGVDPGRAACGWFLGGAGGPAAGHPPRQPAQLDPGLLRPARRGQERERVRRCAELPAVPAGRWHAGDVHDVAGRRP